MIKLFQGDCLTVMDELIKNKIYFDATITDIPYGTTSCKWDSIIPFDEMWSRLKKLRKESAPIILFGSEPFSSALRMSNIKEFKYDWVWYKNMTSGFALAKKQPMRNHENISVFYNKQCLYNPIKEKRDLNEDSVKRLKYEYSTTKGENVVYNKIPKIKYVPEDTENRYPTTVKKFNCVPTSCGRLHPTQKPVALLEYLIKTYTNEGDTVLDFTFGSGTTGVACKKLNRKFIGIEKDKNYFDIAVKRIQETEVLDKTA